MNAAQIIEQARLTTGTDANVTNFSNVSLEPILNLAYHSIGDWAVASFDEDLFFAEYRTDTVVGQTKYQINSSFQKIMEVGIKWSSTDEYEIITQTEENYWTETGTYYDIQGDYITLSKEPENAVIEGLYVKVVTNLVDITSSSTESQVFPSCTYFKEFQNLLVWALRPRLYMLKGQINEKQAADADLDREKRRVKEVVRSQNGMQPTRRKSTLDNFYMG